MLYAPRFELESFNTLDIDSKARGVLLLTEALASLNYDYLRHNRFTPSIYASGVAYSRVCDPGPECAWKDIPRCLSTGTGDCKDFTAWRVAELRLQSEAALPFVEVRHKGGNGILYHVLVRRSNGALEDPSILLGMPIPR